MDRDEFWELIRRHVTHGKHGPDVRALRAELSGRPPSSIIAFDRILGQLLSESYRFRLWGAAFLIHGYCSSDTFDYFRAWLITKGREVFELAIADPDALVDVDTTDGASGEGLLSGLT